MPNTSKIPIYVALLADIGITVAKYIAAVISSSSVMLAEAIHSTVDSGTELLLLFGIKQSEKPADKQHPFGYGKEIYFWTLVVSIIIFALGGCISIYRGIVEFMHPHVLNNLVTDYIVLSISLVFEIASFYTALRKFPEWKSDKGFWENLRLSKDPALFAVLYEGAGALIGILIGFAGVFLTGYFSDSRFDCVASVLIGLLLCVISYIMVRESKHLLVGESANHEMVDAIFEMVNADKDVYTLNQPITMQLSPSEVLLAMDIQFRKDIKSQDLAIIIDRLENLIRNRFPEITRIYLEAKTFVQYPKPK